MTTEHRHPRCVSPSRGVSVAPITTGGELAAARRDLEVVAERLVTIADEAFGLGPVEPIDATLTRIEAGIFAARTAVEWERNEHSRTKSMLDVVAAERDELQAEVHRLIGHLDAGPLCSSEA
jgi:hypothetical protein